MKKNYFIFTNKYKQRIKFRGIQLLKKGHNLKIVKTRMTRRENCYSVSKAEKTLNFMLKDGQGRRVTKIKEV